MDNSDVRTIREILQQKGRNDLADLLAGARGEVDESSSYGSFLFSTISQYLFFIPLKNYHKIKKISEHDKSILLDSVLYIYPYQDQAPEIRSIDFRLLKESKSELIKLDNEEVFDHDFVIEQLGKCDDKIIKEDYDGAISSAGSLLEGVFDDIYKKCVGKGMRNYADLRERYKKIKPLLKLSDEQYSNESVKSMMHGLSAIVGSIDSLRNQMGDRHLRLSKPWKRHAKLCVNSSRILSDFLYETFAFQQEKIVGFYIELIELLDGSRRLLKKELLLADQDIIKHLNKYDVFLKQAVKNKFINKFDIGRFRESDIFFSAMQIFFDDLNEEDIKNIFEKNKNNSQACGLEYFLRLVETERPEMLNVEIVRYLDDKKKERGESESNEVPF